ncbi:MAG: GNAT family N-acetyltransferase [Oscillospiraceae bacterium]|jgi:diamine N-acetyltransferase|nr:GNAT family N-acetyltransferase [Oscillospiraceae bacterium]
MVTLRKITHQNLCTCIYDIKTTEEQKNFVDSNVESLAEAYASITNGGFATPYAVYDNDTMVGFVMYTYADELGGDLAPPLVLPCYFIWRILIDRNHQRKGYAKQAIEIIITEIKTMPYGKADRIYTSWAPENIASKSLFASFGFVETGEIDGDEDDYEVIVKLDI